MMKEPFHEGEIEVQGRVGVRAMAEKIGHGIHDDIPAIVAAFVREQSMLIAATIDRSGALWASLLTGAPGFAHAVDPHTLRVDAEPGEGDPLAGTLRSGAALGVLTIEFATRRRMRLNGIAEPIAPRGFLLRVREVFGNCPKYIQQREAPADPPRQTRGRLLSDAQQLSASQRRWIETADTFFIASAHPVRGADVSHRGGDPGFVRFADGETLVWPEYTGNMMFQTLGNLRVNPSAGLLFLDFSEGRTLQLTGKTTIVWDPTAHPGFAGAQRFVELRVERAIEIADNLPPGWRFVEASPFNPR